MTRDTTDSPTQASGMVYDHILHDILARRRPKQILRMTVDGVDGSGKTRFADNLADYLTSKALPVIRISLDDFHNIRDKRYAQGRLSPKGFYEDSYNYEVFRELVLEPLGMNGDGKYRLAYHDVETDKLLGTPLQQADPNAILIVDGIFSNRNELASYWDYSVFLRVDFETTFQRMAIRDGSKANPEDEKNKRYHGGQLLYFKECSPEQRATILIDNRNFGNPQIINR